MNQLIHVVHAEKTVPTKFFVFVSREGDGFSGKVYSSYYRKTYPFRDIWEFLHAVYGLLESVQIPQPVVKLRSFGFRFHKIKLRKAADILDSDIQYTDTADEKKNTFLIHIQFRRNATWQGSITWVEKNKTQHFRSAFEMLKLMDETSHPGVLEKVQWDNEPAPKEE